MCLSYMYWYWHVLADLVAWCWSYAHFHGVQHSPVYVYPRYIDDCDIGVS